MILVSAGKTEKGVSVVVNRMSFAPRKKKEVKVVVPTGGVRGRFATIWERQAVGLK